MLDHSHGVCIIVSATRRVELSAFNSPRQVAGSSAELLTVKAESEQTVWASVTHNTHDHTASKGVSDRLGRGITRASSTFPSALAQNRAREYTPRVGVGWTYQPGTDVSINGLAGPLLTGGI